jgi:hypothetical protein
MVYLKMGDIFMTQKTETSICGAIGVIIFLAAVAPVAIVILGIV